VVNISIVIPVFNEERGLKKTAGQINELLKRTNSESEVIFVDDGSTDRSFDILESFDNHRFRIIRHEVNKGYGAALKTGIRKARADKVVIMDSDGQHSPEYVDEMIKLLDKYPLVIGERDSDSHQVRNRMLGKTIVRIIGEYLVEQRLPDFNSGFRGFRRNIIRSMLSIMPNGFSFSTTSTLAFIKRGYDVGTMPIKVTERVGRRSNVKFIKDGSKTILLIFRIIMLFNPLKIFLPVSFIVSFLGVFWGIFGFIVAKRIPNSAVLVVVLGMLLFFIGLLADQISMLNLREIEVIDEQQ